MWADKSWSGKARVSLLSLSPRLTSRCRRMASTYLTPAEAELFLDMTRYDRAHSILVASRLTDDEMLVRTALVHDAGKLRDELPAWFRTGYTAAEIFARAHLDRVQGRLEVEAGEGTTGERLSRLRRKSDRALFVQSHHGEIAAEMLAALGCELEVVRLVRYHQEVPGPEDAALTRFVRADSAF